MKQSKWYRTVVSFTAILLSWLRPSAIRLLHGVYCAFWRGRSEAVDDTLAITVGVQNTRHVVRQVRQKVCSDSAIM